MRVVVVWQREEQFPGCPKNEACVENPTGKIDYRETLDDRRSAVLKGNALKDSFQASGGRKSPDSSTYSTFQQSD